MSGRDHDRKQNRYTLAADTIVAYVANAVTRQDTGQAQEYRHLRKGLDKRVRKGSFANEFGRLIQGVGGRIKGTNTCFCANINSTI